jgi:hypothetical protein
MIDCEQSQLVAVAHSPVPIWFAMDYGACSEMRYVVMYPEPSTAMQGSMAAPGSNLFSLRFCCKIYNSASKSSILLIKSPRAGNYLLDKK